MTGITREEIERFLAFRGDYLEVRREHIHELAQHALTEQSRIDEAVAKERERCAGIADSFARRNREWAATARAGGADQLTALFSHSANAADEVRSRILSPTPVTEEGE